MKTPSFFELKTLVEYISEQLEGAQLQDIFNCNEGLVLGFYRFKQAPKMVYLVLDLDNLFPFLGLYSEPPWVKNKKNRPVSLFMGAHCKNHYLEKIEVRDEAGRIVYLLLSNGSKIEFRMIPKQVNLIVTNEKKTISLEVVKDLGTHDISKLDTEAESRSIPFMLKQWQERRSNQALKTATDKQALSPYEKWKLSRQKDLDKKNKALGSIKEQIKKLQSEEWSLVGEHIKLSGLKAIKPEWSVYVDFEKSASYNIEKCFQKAKANKAKIAGAHLRLKQVMSEIDLLGDMGESVFERQLQSKTSEANSRTIQADRKLEGRFRKFIFADSRIEAYMGKSAADNMTLLRKSKGQDLWLHLKDYPSAHAIIFKDKQRAVTTEELRAAAQWLAKEGLPEKLTKMGGKFSVVYVECRFVKPIKGDKIGRVTYHNASEILIAI